MWRTPNGEKTFSGPYALMLARGLNDMVDRLMDSLDDREYEEEIMLGHRAFDCLTLEQKIWTLHKVAFGLLDEKTSVCELTAFLEATIASVFRILESYVELEIDMDALPNDDPASRHFWRKTLLVPYELAGGNSPDELEEGEELLTAACNDIDEWALVSEILKAQVLWDADYDLDQFDDLPPEGSAALKQLLRVDDKYFSSIPEDPKGSEAEKLLNEIARLCNAVIKREEKAM